METRKISIIVGSLRKGSLNRQLAQHAARFLEEQGAAVEWLEYSDLPYMNQDIEYPAPAAVVRVRQQVAQAQGLWFFVPEYNHGIPGPLKNLLDWLSRSARGRRRCCGANGRPCPAPGVLRALCAPKTSF